MRDIDPDSEENQRQHRDNERYIGGLKLQAEFGCQHPNITRLPGVTSTGVKISVCDDCHEQLEWNPEE